ncbi:MAG TPA: LysM domain-containing protein [Kribbella sp.]
MSTAAVAAGTPAPRRSSRSASSAHLRVVPDVRTTPSAPAVVRPRRQRIEGTTTDRMPVRGCSGDSVAVRVQRQAGQTGQTEPAAIRLTRRGRMLLTAVSVLVFGAAILVLGLRVAGVLEPGPHFTHTVPVQVAPGQTLWSIAESTNPGQEPAIVVEKIADLNKLTSPADINPGQTLQIPVAG